jgi:hypothetical protein
VWGRFSTLVERKGRRDLPPLAKGWRPLGDLLSCFVSYHVWKTLSSFLVFRNPFIYLNKFSLVDLIDKTFRCVLHSMENSFRFFTFSKHKMEKSF